MQRSMSLRPERVTGVFVVLSLTLGFVVTVTLSSIQPALLPLSPDAWWTWCVSGFGVWYGLTIQFIRTPSVRLIPLPLAGACTFALTQILMVFVFDRVSLGLPYYLAPVVPTALFGGMSIAVFSCFIKERSSIRFFLLLGCLGFGLGQAIDISIRDTFLLPSIAQLNDTAIAAIKLIAQSCFGLCVGFGSCIALQRQ